MMTALLIISYILIGIIIGVVSFVFIMDEAEDCEPVGFAIGLFWPITILTYVIFKLLEFLIRKVYNICVYIHDNGIHYYKGELFDCCGKCKYIEYCNNHNDVNKCKFNIRARVNCVSESCDKFKKHLFWRFIIRLKNN